jgi:integrase
LSPDTWVLPAERSKNGKAQIVHLAEPARAILTRQPRILGCPFVFPGEGLRGPISGFSFIKRKLDAAITAARAEAGLAPAELPDWRFHDFRRSGVTALANLGFAPHVCDRLLNHVTGSIQGVAAVYQRHEFLTERKSALDAWAAHVLAVAEGKAKPDNVVALRLAHTAGGTDAAA